MRNEAFTFYEFFSGGGMARLGLGIGWSCLLANDCDAKKAASYRINFPPAEELLEAPIENLTAKDLKGRPVLAWASFPCQDLSLAGARKGLKGERSGTFWPFWRLMQAKEKRGHKVPLIVLENVVGAITSHKGKDFLAILEALVTGGYSVGPMVVDAIHFIPQSRPRLFIVAIADDLPVPKKLTAPAPVKPWHPNSLVNAFESMPKLIRSRWLWLSLPLPMTRPLCFPQLIEDPPTGVKWHTPEQTSKLLGMMSPGNLSKVTEAKKSGELVIGTLYKRTRPNSDGSRSQRAEVRFDQVSGCLRTPAGGSSRQIVLIVEGKAVRSRLLSPREAARLMGVKDSYILPTNYNDAYHLMGDGLVVPAVGWVERHLLKPLAKTYLRKT